MCTVLHCPPETRHAFVGAGDGPCVLLCASSRQFQKDGPWGFYCADETAALYNAASPEDTQDGGIAYARFPPSRETRYPDGLLPGWAPRASKCAINAALPSRWSCLFDRWSQ